MYPNKHHPRSEWADKPDVTDWQATFFLLGILLFLGGLIVSGIGWVALKLFCAC